MPTVSFSRAKTWRRCHKQHDYKYHQHLQRKRRAIPLIRGTILGEMLDARALGRMGLKKKNPFGILLKYSKEYNRLFQEEKEKYGDVVGDVRKLFEGYERKYSDDTLEYLGVEDFVSLNLVKDIKFIGYIDKRVKDAQERHFLLDHKTHRVIPDEDQRFSDLQKVFYVWAWNSENSTKKVTGFIWDYIRTKAPTVPEQLKNGELTQRANIDTDYWTYLGEIKRLKLDPKPYADTLLRLKKQKDRTYLRVPIPNPSKTIIENVLEDLKSTALEIHSSKNKDRNMTHMCPSTCEFYQLCRAEVSGLDGNFIKKTEYEEREPNEREEAEED
jgi:hypothetical protein